MRCISFGQAWKKQSGIVTIISNCTNSTLIENIIDNGFDFIQMKNSYPDPADIEITLQTINKYQLNKSWVLLDGYNFDFEYQTCIKQNGNNLLIIDDGAHLSNYNADIIVNQNINGTGLKYNCPPSTKLLMGTEYVMLRDDFVKYGNYKRKNVIKPKNILVTFGGSDPQNFSEKILSICKSNRLPKLNVKIIKGNLNTKDTSNKNNYLEIQPSEMPDLMSWADIAITSGGSTVWELAFMGLPALVICFAENQKRLVGKMNKYGSVINLGCYKKITEEDISNHLTQLISNHAMRNEMTIRGANLVDGMGKNRIIDVMKKYD